MASFQYVSLSPSVIGCFGVIKYSLKALNSNMLIDCDFFFLKLILHCIRFICVQSMEAMDPSNEGRDLLWGMGIWILI